MVRPLKIGKTVFDHDLDREEVQKYLTWWHEYMAEIRNTCRDKLGSNYRSVMIRYREAIESVMESEKMGALKATAAVLVAMEAMNVEDSDKMLTVAAGLDLSEEECGIE